MANITIASNIASHVGFQLSVIKFLVKMYKNINSIGATVVIKYAFDELEILK